MKKEIFRISNFQNVISSIESAIMGLKNSDNFLLPSIESAILALKYEAPERNQRINFLMNALGNPCRVESIFKASEHNFMPVAFHEHCDDIEDTVVLIRTEYGKTIGGYTHYPWTSPPDWDFVRDEGRRSFIFSLDMMEIFVPQQDKFLICCNGAYGPGFGSGKDIAI